jgi:hypothetical protein
LNPQKLDINKSKEKNCERITQRENFIKNILPIVA